MEDLFERIVNLVLGNITWLIFALFLLSGFFGKGNKEEDQKQPTTTRQQPQRRAQQVGKDQRPLAERMAEAFGMQELVEEARRDQQKNQRERQQPSRPPVFASDARRGTTTGSVQDQYPELFGGRSMFDDRDDMFGAGKTKWGFDETEWGSTFEKNEEQWGGGFPERRNSEPRIEWPS